MALGRTPLGIRPGPSHCGVGNKHRRGGEKQAGATQMGAGPRAIADTLPAVGVIVASLNVVLPGAMLGEVTPDIAQAILGARATKVLLPLNRARVEIVGADPCTLETLITQSLSRVRVLVS